MFDWLIRALGGVTRADYDMAIKSQVETGNSDYDPGFPFGGFTTHEELTSSMEKPMKLKKIKLVKKSPKKKLTKKALKK